MRDFKATRCGLPGCDKIIIQENGDQPIRKYCCSAHRMAARHARRQEQLDADTSAASPSTATVVRTPALLGRQGPGLAGHARRTRPGTGGRGAAAGRPPHRRNHRRAFVATTFLVALTAGGLASGVRLATPPPAQVQHHPEALPTHAAAHPPVPSELAVASAAWSKQAAHTVQKLQHQIRELSRVNRRALAVPVPGRSAELIQLMRRLSRHIADLERKKNSLQVGIAVQRLYLQSSAQLNSVRSELSYLHAAQLGTSPGGTGSSGQVIATLSGQEKSLRAQVGTWEKTLHHSMDTPISTRFTGDKQLAQQALQVAETPVSPVSAGQQPPFVPLVPSRRVVRPTKRGNTVVATGPGSPSGQGAAGEPAAPGQASGTPARHSTRGQATAPGQADASGQVSGRPAQPGRAGMARGAPVAASASGPNTASQGSGPAQAGAADGGNAQGQNNPGVNGQAQDNQGSPVQGDGSTGPVQDQGSTQSQDPQGSLGQGGGSAGPAQDQQTQDQQTQGQPGGSSSAGSGGSGSGGGSGCGDNSSSDGSYSSGGNDSSASSGSSTFGSDDGQNGSPDGVSGGSSDGTGD